MEAIHRATEGKHTMSDSLFDPPVSSQLPRYSAPPPAQHRLQYLLNHPLCPLTPELPQHTAALLQIMQHSCTKDNRKFLTAAHQFVALIEHYRFLHTGLAFTPHKDAVSTLDSLCHMLPEYEPTALASTALADLLDRIRSHYAHPIAFRDAALCTHFSSSYFSLLFKKPPA